MPIEWGQVKGAKDSVGEGDRRPQHHQTKVTAKQPPLLVTKTLTTFKGLRQELVPKHLVKRFLVQQMTTAKVRQYQLQPMEAVIAHGKMKWHQDIACGLRHDGS